MSELTKVEQIALSLTSAIVSTLSPNNTINHTAVDRYYEIRKLVLDKEKQDALQLEPRQKG
jgi:hypothetical protein